MIKKSEVSEKDPFQFSGEIPLVLLCFSDFDIEVSRFCCACAV
jgi:hypothetical protein